MLVHHLFMKSFINIHNLLYNRVMSWADKWMYKLEINCFGIKTQIENEGKMPVVLLKLL